MDPRYLLRQSADLMEEAVIGGKYPGSWRGEKKRRHVCPLAVGTMMTPTNGSMRDGFMRRWLEMMHATAREGIYIGKREHMQQWGLLRAQNRTGLRTGGVAAGHVNPRASETPKMGRSMS